MPTCCARDQCKNPSKEIPSWFSCSVCGGAAHFSGCTKLKHVKKPGERVQTKTYCLLCLTKEEEVPTFSSPVPVDPAPTAPADTPPPPCPAPTIPVDNEEEFPVLPSTILRALPPVPTREVVCPPVADTASASKDTIVCTLMWKTRSSNCKQ